MYFKLVACFLMLIIAADAFASKRDDKRLIKAVVSGNVESVQKALDKGAPNVNITDRKKFGSGNTALEYVLEKGDYEIAKLLIDRGAGTKDAFHSAIYREDEETVRFLVDTGVDPNVTDSMGRSALGKAKSEEIQNLLLELGAVPVCGSSVLRQVSKEGKFVVLGTVKDCDLKELEFYDNEGALVCTGPAANRGCR